MEAIYSKTGNEAAYHEAIRVMSPWCRSLLLKATILLGYEGAITSSDYDVMSEDERDFFYSYLIGKSKGENADKKT